VNINNKFKQFCQGNWGKPTKTEQKKPLNFDVLENETVKCPSKKKKGKKKAWLPYGSECPFCGKKLEEVQDKDPDYKDSVLRWWRRSYVPTCKCGAYLVENCPACHRETWFRNKIYKHQDAFNCGFVGKRK